MARALGPPEEAKPVLAGVVWSGLGWSGGGLGRYEVQKSTVKRDRFEHLDKFDIGKHRFLAKRKS